MVMANKLVTVVVFSVFLAAFAILSISENLSIFPVKAETEVACPSGHAGARLTGWQLNNKYPLGTASYVEATKALKVEVTSVALPNGTVLSVFVNETRVGDLSPLADGAASSTFTQSVPDGARIRVVSADRPIVSSALQCVDAPKATSTTTARSRPTPSPTATRSPSPSPTSTPLPSPTLQPVPTPTISPAPSPSPGESPTPDPMPKSSPAPSPSPGE